MGTITCIPLPIPRLAQNAELFSGRLLGVDRGGCVLAVPGGVTADQHLHAINHELRRKRR